MKAWTYLFNIRLGTSICLHKRRCLPLAPLKRLCRYLILSAVLEQPDHFGLRISGDDEAAFDANKEWSDENEAMFQFWEDDLHVSKAVHVVLACSFALAMSL